MKVCLTCKREMNCSHNGTILLYANGHAYSGDVYDCPGCGAKIVITSLNPFHLNDSQIQRIREKGGEIVKMVDTQ